MWLLRVCCQYSHFLLSFVSNFKDMEPYELDRTLPVNATEYIFQALKPRLVK